MLGVSHVYLLKYALCSRGIIVLFVFFFSVSLTTVTKPPNYSENKQIQILYNSCL